MLAAPAPLKLKLTFDLKAHIAALAGPAVGAAGARLGAAPPGWAASGLVDVRIALWMAHPDAGDVSDNLAGVRKQARTCLLDCDTKSGPSTCPSCRLTASMSPWCSW